MHPETPRDVTRRDFIHTSMAGADWEAEDHVKAVTVKSGAHDIESPH